MIAQDLFDRLSEDPDIPEDLLMELLQHTAFNEISDEEYRRLCGDEVDAWLDDNATPPPEKKAPIDYKVCPFLTTKQAAHYLCLSFRTLEKMRVANTGPTFRKHGRYVRYHVDDLEIWSKGRGSPNKGL